LFRFYLFIYLFEENSKEHVTPLSDMLHSKQKNHILIANIVEHKNYKITYFILFMFKEGKTDNSREYICKSN